jgi:flagellar motor switch protein FliN/FliY
MDQNEIDALVGNSSDPGEGGAPAGADGVQDEAGGVDAGGLAQTDSDAALAGEGTPEAKVSADNAATGDSAPEQEAGLGEEEGTSQADIDTVMDGADGGAVEKTAGTKDAPEVEAAPVGLDSEGRPVDELGAAMAAAVAEEKAAAGDPGSSAADLSVEEVHLPTFDQEALASEVSQPISLLHDVELHVKIELGRTRMFVEDVLRLGEGSVVELDRLAGDPVDVYVNSRLVARGEVLVLNDNFCVRVSEIISNTDARLAG